MQPLRILDSSGDYGKRSSAGQAQRSVSAFLRSVEYSQEAYVRTVQPRLSYQTQTALNYDPWLTRMIGSVGTAEPPSSSMVTPKFAATTPFGICGRITVA